MDAGHIYFMILFSVVYVYRACVEAQEAIEIPYACGSI